MGKNDGIGELLELVETQVHREFGLWGRRTIQVKLATPSGEPAHVLVNAKGPNGFGCLVAVELEPGGGCPPLVKVLAELREFGEHMADLIGKQAMTEIREGRAKVEPEEG